MEGTNTMSAAAYSMWDSSSLHRKYHKRNVSSGSNYQQSRTCYFSKETVVYINYIASEGTSVITKEKISIQPTNK